MAGEKEADQGFIDFVARLRPAPQRRDAHDPLQPTTQLTGERALALLTAQLRSRHADFAARRLREQGAGYYTIGSSGHEGNAVLAEVLRVDDPAFLHYRSGAFFVHRASRVPGQNPVRDILLGAVASAEEPIAGGRHKVFGSAVLQIPPQTSTIASHLPKAVGMAFALERARRLGVATPVPSDAVVVCSFGDASANHSTAVGAMHAACRIAQQAPVPVLFVCEDNRIGISVPTPGDWIATAFRDRPGLFYARADSGDLVATYEASCAVVQHVRRVRRPAFLHLDTVRLMGHAGSDVELTYRSPAAIAADLERDPLRRAAAQLVSAGVASPDEILALYEQIRAEVDEAARSVAGSRRLAGAAEIAAPLAYPPAERVAAEVARRAARPARTGPGGEREADRPLPLGLAINRALGDILDRYPEGLLFGEDVARKGGVYGVTRGLVDRAGAARVFDTILDEQTILGVAIGAGHAGFLPIPEIQYLAYLHNAEDQLRGEAATLAFFSRGQFRNPMVVRIAAYGYQKGFGGHFHNDNSIAVLRDIPGIVIASPCRGDDAAAMLHTCAAAAHDSGSVCVFLEPIALYTARDLEPGDGWFLSPYRGDVPHVPLGASRLWGEGGDLLLVSFANGVPMSLRAARRLEAQWGIRSRVLDLRWLAPLPTDELLAQARQVGAVLVVDETRRTGGVSEGILATLVDAGFTGRMARVASRDCFIPLGDAAEDVLLGVDEIVSAGHALLHAPAASGRKRRRRA
jgi:2-oxoisovalerate dehydrogenase E1 component